MKNDRPYHADVELVETRCCFILCIIAFMLTFLYYLHIFLYRSAIKRLTVY